MASVKHPCELVNGIQPQFHRSNGHFIHQWIRLNAILMGSTDISCFKSATRAKFRARFTTFRKLRTAPMLEGSRKRCNIQAVGEAEYLLDLRGADFHLCGVRSCNPDQEYEHFCLNLRFQNVAGLLLADDTLLKIECRPHRPTAEQIRHFTIPVDENRKSRFRSPPVLAKGGDLEPKMESEISLLRKHGNYFIKSVEPGATLQLGEELMIKSVVQSNNADGWQFSRMSDVVAHGVSKWGSKHNSNHDDDDTVVIVDTEGCRNPALTAVCPFNPEQDEDDPLVSTLILRVFMMDDMQDGDEMEIKVRTTACVEHHDCHSNCLNQHSWHKRIVRSKRNIQDKTANKNSSVYFKIGIPPSASKNERRKGLKLNLRLVGLVFIGSMICVLFAIAVLIFRKIQKYSV